MRFRQRIFAAIKSREQIPPEERRKLLGLTREQWFMAEPRAWVDEPQARTPQDRLAPAA